MNLHSHTIITYTHNSLQHLKPNKLEYREISLTLSPPLMAALRASSSLLLPSSSSSSSSASTQVPKLPKLRVTNPSAAITRKLVEELSARNGRAFADEVRVLEQHRSPSSTRTEMTSMQLYAILEAVADRVEMHRNIGEQRDNWNKLLLNSVNVMTLSAATMAALAAVTPAPAMRVCSALLFTGATGVSLIMNKIQPSQLAEEQRNATRLFKQLRSEIESILAVRSPSSESDVKGIKEMVLALDRAYPLPLLGAMLDKFPASLEPAVWWPRVSHNRHHETRARNVASMTTGRNGWSEELEAEMRAIIQVLERKDKEDYLRLGNLALKFNKILAVSGPLLTAVAAAGSALGGPKAATVATIAGAMAAVINAFEHGGQVGMVVEMYRNCAGSFELLEETIESTLEEGDWSKRENGESFERKVALKLGRSLSQLRGFAAKAKAGQVDEFASKLF